MKDNQIWHYLHDNPDESMKWGSFISGASNISMKEIGQMTAPELSVLAYALRKRNKNTAYLFNSRLGGKK